MYICEKSAFHQYNELERVNEKMNDKGTKITICKAYFQMQAQYAMII